MAYPTLPLQRTSKPIRRDGRDEQRAVGGTTYVRNFYTADKVDWELRHKALTASELATLEAHYAPSTPIELVGSDDIEARIGQLHARGERVALWARSGVGGGADLRLAMPGDPAAAAHALYDALRSLDRSRCQRILIEHVPEGAAWHAVADRLRRAVAGSRLEAQRGAPR